MNTDRWQRITDIVYECLEHPAAERRERAWALCGNDEALFVEAMQWVEIGNATELPLTELPSSPSLSGSIAKRVDEAIRSVKDWRGVRLGAYRIVEEIARGGMGSVFKAIRADDAYEKIVAIKLIRSNLATEIVAQRFRAERQILANLDHSHIARLIDGGQDEDGDPYLVMEYIDGMPIDRYCEEKLLPVSERLKLFRDVCSAVQYAHQRLVVHRDLKPSNILVDGSGNVKLLDFGIAKLLDQTQLDESGKPIAQPTEANAMTPAYASPEQVKGEAITTSSDVYALGVLLYRLLSGKSPYKHDNTQPLELAKEIVDTEPERPSERLTKPDSPRPTEKSLDDAKVVRTLDTKRLQKELRGDLDNIVLMALRKEPHRRYATVEQLSDDIRRSQANEPVLARADTWAYRAHKFVSRNRWAVGFALLALAGLISGIATTAWQAQEARLAQARAEKHFATVRKFANSLIFEVHEQVKSLEGATSVSENVLTSAKNYLDSLRSDLGTDLALQREVAIAYGRLGLAKFNFGQPHLGKADEAMQHLTTAHELLQQLRAANYEQVRSARDAALAQNSIAKIEATRGKHTEAIARLVRVDEDLASQPTTKQDERDFLDRMRVVLIETRADIRDGTYGPTTELNLTRALLEIDEAIKLSRQASSTLASDRRVAAANDLNLLRDRRARILSRIGRIEDALVAFREAMIEAERIAAIDENNISWRLALSNVTSATAEANLLAGDGPKAIELHARALDLLQTKLAAQTSDSNFATNHLLAKIHVFRAVYLVRGAEAALLRLPDLTSTLANYERKFPIDYDMAKNIRAVALIKGRALSEVGRDAEAVVEFARALQDTAKIADAEGLLGIAQANLGLAMISVKTLRVHHEIGPRLQAAAAALSRVEEMVDHIDFDVLAQLASTTRRFEELCKTMARRATDNSSSGVCKVDRDVRGKQLTERVRAITARTPITL